ncbi:MAG TPA: hypothetical protein VHW23_44665 [Kofleriaceae bacterium]|jgi:hypothetical protein|nr:hypothetical protein [Kofleriaceae bacterium]
MIADPQPASTRALRARWRAAGLAPVALLAGCAMLASSRHPSPEVSPPSEARPAPPPAVPALGFVLESALRARRPYRGQPDLLLELGNGATVVDGDRLQIAARTSRDAYLYLAFCSQHATDPRFAGLKVFPDHGALRVRAHETTIAPDPAAEIVLDDQPGRETLYLIFSQVELSRADSDLADAIAAARRGSQAADCATPFRAAPGRARDPRPTRVWSGKPPAAGKRPAPGSTRATPKTSPPEQDPVVEIQRGGDIVWNDGAPVGVEADPDGIVVLRFALNHVAAP